MPFQKDIYTKNIDNPAENPYATWLRHTDEKDLLLARLPAIFQRMRFSQSPRFPRDFPAVGRDPANGGGSPVPARRILGIGDGTGHTAIRILQLLDDLQIPFHYTATDPYQEQLDVFKTYSVAPNRANITFHPVPLNEIGPSTEPYDLVIASHSLYYVPDWPTSIPHLLSLGKETLIVHHGPRGIHQFHQRYRPFVHPGEHVISTYKDLARHLPETGFTSFPSTVNVAPCHDPNSQDGRNLLTFFLERDFDELPQYAQDEIRFWFRTRFPETMTHDVGIFVAQRT
ncbi:MAG: methyltransferase domain-containing protein [Candidatus Uhrbacteria bacterium]